MMAAVRGLWQRHGIPRHALPWLIYLAALGFQPAFEPSDAVRAWTWVAALVAAFLPIYAWTTRTIELRPFLWPRGPGAVLGLTAIVVLGLVGSAVNTGATDFLVYASSLAGRVRARRHAWMLVALATVGVGVAGLLSGVPDPYRLGAFGTVLALTPILGMASLYELERSRSNERLRMAQDEIERLAAVAERERIARPPRSARAHPVDRHAQGRALRPAARPRSCASLHRDRERRAHLARGPRRGACRISPFGSRWRRCSPSRCVTPSPTSSRADADRCRVALCFSVVTLTTVGYGDLASSPRPCSIRSATVGTGSW